MKTLRITTVALLALLLCAPDAFCARKKKQETPQETTEDIERQILLMQKQKELKKAKRSATAVEIPCQDYDDEQWYVGTGKARVRSDKLSTEEYTKLLKSCQLLLKSKIKGRYQAVVRDYFEQLDVNEKSTVTSHIESAGQQVIDQYLDDTQETCREETDEDDQGYVTVYMNVKISKRQLASAMTDGVAKQISKESAKDKAMQVRFNEEKFRQSALKVFEREGKDAKAEASQGE
ncbi:MAG: hypothetical protein LBT94_01875 [Prevotellaceae bacterium]|nr:hypothetical protein [Prevotellaceae bacterium]